MSLLRWLKEHEPERYAQIGCGMMTHDYLRWCLTGVKGCEESNISESNLYNMSLGEYDPCLTDWLGIAEINHAPAACCRICRNLRGDHRSDSRPDRSESGYARCWRPV
ncbi:FGGY family carbohydrate kinase [Escherichia coli]